MASATLTNAEMNCSMCSSSMSFHPKLQRRLGSRQQPNAGGREQQRQADDQEDVVGGEHHALALHQIVERVQSLAGREMHGLQAREKAARVVEVADDLGARVHRIVL